MTLRFYYSPLVGSDIEISDRINWPDIDIGMMANGDGWSGDLIINDPDGDFVPMAYRRIHAEQDAAPAGARNVGNWFITPKIRVLRQGSKQVGASRTYIVTMTDENSLLERRKFVGSDADRSSETDIARIRWMLASTELNTLSPDETYIDTSGPITLDAVDLHNQSPGQILASIRGRTQRHYWVKYEEAALVGGAIVSSSVAASTTITTTTAHGLFTGMTVVIAGHSGSTPSLNGSHVITVTGTTTYTIPVTVTVGGTGGTTSTVGRFVLWYANMNTSSLYASTISLSNILSETLNDPLVWELGKASTELDRDVGRMASGLLGPWKQKVEYIQDTDVGNAYAYVDQVAGDLYNVTTEASAITQITRQLTALAVPDDEIVTTLTVQGPDLNLVRHGMIVSAHVSHFPNYTDDSDPDVPGYLKPGWADGFVECRVMERSIRRVGSQDGSETFEMPIRLSPMRIPPCVDGVIGYDIVSGLYNLPIGPTTSGFRYYLSHYGSVGDFVASDPDGLTFYPYSSNGRRPVPGAGPCGPSLGCAGAWYFRNYGHAAAGMPTGFADGGQLVDPKVRMIVVGPGTATVWLESGSVGTVELVGISTPIPSDPDFDGVVSISSVSISTPSTTVVVPNDEFCLHAILVHDSAANQTSVGFGGWDWLAAP